MKDTKLADKKENLVISNLSSKQLIVEPVSEGVYTLSENNERRLVDQ